MASLLDLPFELCLEVTKFLDLGDKVHLSATCKSYRTQLLPEVFHTIRFTNDDASAASAAAAVEAHGQHTKAIEFTCQCEEPQSQPTLPCLPPAACEVLKGRLTPNLQTVKLKFYLDLDNDDSENGVWDIFHDRETADDTRRNEIYDTWRALLNETWEALVANTFVKELILRELPPTWASTYYTDAFHQFLGRLESASIQFLCYCDYAENWTRRGFGTQDFLGSLGDLFFRHMKGLKHLYINAPDPLGLSKEDGMDTYIPLTLMPEDLPLLQTLKLESCFICNELVAFLQAHAEVLESLDINECFSGHSEEYPKPGIFITWEKFFDEVYKAEPRLTELLVGDNTIPYLDDEELSLYQGEDEPWNESMRQKLDADRTLKIFRHVTMSSEGTFITEEQTNVERFISGNDQRAYGRLMELVKKNRAGKV